MEISSDVYKSLVFVFILLTVHFLLMTANGEVTTAMTACSPENPDCYFERFANFKIPQVEPVKVGHLRKLNLIEGVQHQMVTAAIHPPIFEIANFLSHEECDHIIKLAKEEGMEESRTLKEGVQQDTRALGKNTKKNFDLWDKNQDGQIDKDEMVHSLENLLDFTPDRSTLLQMYSALDLDTDRDEKISLQEYQKRNVREMAKFIGKVKEEMPHTKSRHSQQAWIQSASGRSDSIMASIEKRVQRLTMLPMELIKASEYLQVVSYGPMGHYNCHLDSDFIRPLKPCCHFLGSELNHCRICRFATVLYFLNTVEDGGETAFPIADNRTFDDQEWIRDTENVCNLAKNCYKANVVVKPERGKAILWYNHMVDNSTGWLGELDKYSFHGGCDVRRGTKWIANHWISLSEDRQKDIQNWIEIGQYEEQQRKMTNSSSNESIEEGYHQEL